MPATASDHDHRDDAGERHPADVREHRRRPRGRCAEPAWCATLLPSAAVVASVAIVGRLRRSRRVDRRRIWPRSGRAGRVVRWCVGLPAHPGHASGSISSPSRRPWGRRIRSVKTDRKSSTVPKKGTYSPKPGEIERHWHVIDANDIVLGRLASQAARLLRGKHKPQFAPHVDTGDFVIIVNAAKVAVAGQQARRVPLPPLRLPGRPVADAPSASCSSAAPSASSSSPCAACCRRTRSAGPS